MPENTKLSEKFFQRDVLNASPELLGKILVRRFENGHEERYTVSETEAYRGEEDLACHASKGRTKRTDVMYGQGGKIYVYLIYGIYWLLNITTSLENHPQAILIRGVKGISGPGRLGKVLKLDASFYGESSAGERLWFEDSGERPKYISAPRIGIDYAGPWKDKLWRFISL